MNILDILINTIRKTFFNRFESYHTYAGKRILYKMKQQVIFEDGKIDTLYYSTLPDFYIHPDYEHKYPDEVIYKKKVKVIFVYKDYIYYLDNDNKIKSIFSANL